jgi:hypothetical protein
MKVLFATFALLVSTTLFADTATYIENGALKASINTDGESETLYNALTVEALEGRSGFAKVYRSKDGVVEISCTKSELPSEIPYGCTIGLDFQKEDAVTNLYQDNNFLKANFPFNVEEAEMLYELLDLDNVEGRSGEVKFFKTADKRAEIYCTKSDPGFGIPYMCTISIEIPKSE